jgi:hypothetical protein
MPKGIRLTKEEVIKRILIAFPDKDVTDISSFFKQNNSILRFIKRKADEKQISFDKYLENLGFKVIHSRDYTHFLKRLEIDFPDKIININLTSIHYYTHMNNFCNKLNIPLKIFLKKIGYKIQKSKK